MPTGAQLFQMLSGIGDTIGTGITDSSRAGALATLGGQIKSGDLDGAISTAFANGDLATGQALLKQKQTASAGGAADALLFGAGGAIGGAQTASAAGGGAAALAPRTMQMPADPEIENRFISTLKQGGLTNPNGLAAVAAYANAESRYSPQNITGSWSDPSQSGQPGTSGGILSWRGDRLANMRQMTAGAGDPVEAQAKFMLTENPDLTVALQNAKSPEEAHTLMANAWKFAGYDQPGGENARRLALTQSYLGRVGGGTTPQQVAATPAPAGPVRTASTDPNFMPASSPAAATPGQVLVSQAAARPGAAPIPLNADPLVVVPGINGGRPINKAWVAAQPDGADVPDDGVLEQLQGTGGAPAQGAAPSPASVSASAPQVLVQAGAPQAVSAAIASTNDPSRRAQILMRAALIPGLDEGRQKLIGQLLTNELDQTKTPDSVKQYLYAKSQGDTRTFTDWTDRNQNGKDEGAKITAQISAREADAKARQLDATDPAVRAWIQTGHYPSGDHARVLRPGESLVDAKGNVLNKGAAASGMSDDTANFLAERVIAGDTRALVGLGRGAQGAESLTKIQGLVAQKAAERGIDASDLIHNSAVAAGMGAAERTGQTQEAKMGAAGFEANNMIDIALKASDTVPRTKFVPINRALQAWQTNTGDPDIRAFGATVNGLVNSYSRAISPSGVGTVADKDHARELLSTADSPQAFRAVTNIMRQEIEAAHKSPGQASQYREQQRQLRKTGAQPQTDPTANNLSAADTAQSLANARAAVSKNPAARAQVLQRLQDAGIDPSGL